MIDLKNTDKVMRLFDIVVNECCCAWSIFLDNVESEGWTSDMLQSEIDMCNCHGDFMRLAGKFV